MAPRREGLFLKRWIFFGKSKYIVIASILKIIKVSSSSFHQYNRFESNISVGALSEGSSHSSNMKLKTDMKIEKLFLSDFSVQSRIESKSRQLRRISNCKFQTARHYVRHTLSRAKTSISEISDTSEGRSILG